MVRACCVLNCSSGKNVPSHTFPKDTERRKIWFLALHIEPLKEEKEIGKLRVCYKHFSEDDYSGSSTRRVLLHIAVPRINVPEHELELVDEQHEEHQQEENEEQHQQQNQERETLADNESYISLQQEENQKMLSQHQIELQQHKEILMQQQQEIENIKKTLNMQKIQARPDLEEVTRKSLLSPKAKKLYEQIVKMKKDKRRLKRLINIRKKQKHVEKSIQLNTTDHKSKIDNTAHMRQQLVNMIVRNNDVAPQARRYTIEEKMFCIGIYRRSRSSYKFISKYLLCPSPNTLDKQLQSIPFDTGCNNIMLKYLKLAAKEIDLRDLNIVIIWDEMSLQPAIHYDKKNDKIIGFED